MFTQRRCKSVVALLSLLAIFGVTSAKGQSKIEDRRAFIWADRPTTDDPRHIPVKPIPESHTIGNANALVPDTYIAELKWFVKGGYSIPQALITATGTNAEMLDVDDKLGTIQVGKLADLIVVDGKPDQNLDDLLNIDMVFRDGRVGVQHGLIFIPRHVPKPLPKPSPRADVN